MGEDAVVVVAPAIDKMAVLMISSSAILFGQSVFHVFRDVSAVQPANPLIGKSSTPLDFFIQNLLLQAKAPLRQPS